MVSRDSFYLDPYPQGGNAVPTLALTWATSVALIVPLAFTSSRKFEPLTSWPTCALVRLTSEALTTALPFTSPTSTPMETGTSPVVDRKSTRLNSSHVRISYAVFCLRQKRSASHARPA